MYMHTSLLLSRTGLVEVRVPRPGAALRLSRLPILPSTAARQPLPPLVVVPSAPKRGRWKWHRRRLVLLGWQRSLSYAARAAGRQGMDPPSQQRRGLLLPPGGPCY